MCFFDQEIFLFLGVTTGGHDQLHDRRKLLLFLLLFWFLEVMPSQRCVAEANNTLAAVRIGSFLM